MTDCPKCGNPLLVHQPWRLQPDLVPGKKETEYGDEALDQPYMHRDCANAVEEAIRHLGRR